jgi:hypothetical protein
MGRAMHDSRMRPLYMYGFDWEEIFGMFGKISQ